MLIVAERINASRHSIAEAIESQNTVLIQQETKAQVEAGADYIDVNAGTFVGEEEERLTWIVRAVQEVTDLPLCIDSPDPKVVEAGLSVHKGTAMMNSICLEKERYDSLIPVIAGTDLKIVALCTSDAGMPKTAEDRINVAEELANALVKNNIKLENIYVDPLVQPVATDVSFGREFLTAIEDIMNRFEGIHTICGLSNISFGLPERKFLNRNFMVMAIAKGLDGAIMDPLDRRMMTNIIVAETLAGRDNFCMNYLTAYREEKLEI